MHEKSVHVFYNPLLKSSHTNHIGSGKKVTLVSYQKFHQRRLPYLAQPFTSLSPSTCHGTTSCP